jgi:hypothetical protein
LAAWLLAALLPLAAQAMRVTGAGGADWVEICSAQGARWVNADTGAAPAAAEDGETRQAGMAWPHCPLCSAHAPVVALPPAAAQALPLLSLQHTVPRLFLVARRGLHAWQSAQARAPPGLA